MISFIASIGNYDYGFSWHLLQDGTIEAEVKATGIVNTAAVPPGVTPRHGSSSHRGVNAIAHQHFFCARLDFDLDGRRNTVHEVDTVLTPRGPDNPFGSGFEAVPRTLRRELEAPALVDPLRGRFWLVTNEHVRNAWMARWATSSSPVRTCRRSPSPTRRLPAVRVSPSATCG